jgi:peroxiredoxin
MRKIRVGETVHPRELITIVGERIRIPDQGQFVHLQFRRFAGCAGCNLHLREFAKRLEEITAAGIREVAVFYSPVKAMMPHQGDLPFAVVSDPARALYREFGVETKLRSVLSPRAWFAWARGAITLPTFPQPPREGESKLGLPADFLIGTDGRILALKYGVHAYDQWTVDELLSLAREPMPAQHEALPG